MQSECMVNMSIGLLRTFCFCVGTGIDWMCVRALSGGTHVVRGYKTEIEMLFRNCHVDTVHVPAGHPSKPQNFSMLAAFGTADTTCIFVQMCQATCVKL